MHRNNYQNSSYKNGQLTRNHLNTQNVEQDNEIQADELRDKVASLKSLTIEIGNEVREHNKFLDTLGDDLEKSRGLLGAAFSKLGFISRKGYKQSNICYLLMFCFVVFWIMWFVSKS